MLTFFGVEMLIFFCCLAAFLAGAIVTLLAVFHPFACLFDILTHTPKG